MTHSMVSALTHPVSSSLNTVAAFRRSFMTLSQQMAFFTALTTPGLSSWVENMPPMALTENVLAGVEAGCVRSLHDTRPSGGGSMEGDDSVETARGDMTSGGVSGGVGDDASSVEQERGGVAFTPGMSTSLRVELSSLVVCCTIASWLLGLVGGGVVMGSGGSAISIWS